MDLKFIFFISSPKNPSKQLEKLPDLNSSIPHIYQRFKSFSEVITASSNPLILSNSWNLAAQSGVKNNLIFISTLNMLEVGFSVNR